MVLQVDLRDVIDQVHVAMAALAVIELRLV